MSSVDTSSSKKPSLFLPTEESTFVRAQRQEKALCMGDSGKCVAGVSGALMGEAGKGPEW